MPVREWFEDVVDGLATVGMGVSQVLADLARWAEVAVEWGVRRLRFAPRAVGLVERFTDEAGITDWIGLEEELDHQFGLRLRPGSEEWWRSPEGVATLLRIAPSGPPAPQLTRRRDVLAAYGLWQVRRGRE